MVWLISLAGFFIPCEAATSDVESFSLVEIEDNPVEDDVFDLSDLLIGCAGLQTRQSWEDLKSFYVRPVYFRRYNGKSYDLRPAVAYNNRELAASSPTLTALAKEWAYIRGEVISVTSEGVLVYTSKERSVFLVMPKSVRDLYVDGSSIKTLGVKIGTYQYTSVDKAFRTVEKFTYGELDPLAFTIAAEKVDRAVVKWGQRLEEYKAVVAEEKQLKLNEADRKALEFQIKRAESGSASAQYDLAVRYLEGKNVEPDEAKAKLWLQKSAAQDYGPAKKKLQELEAEPVSK